MVNSKIEIECFLNLYPIALAKATKIKREKQPNSCEEYKFYYFIINTVERWMDSLYEDEKLIIEYRFFKHYNYSQIAIKTNYSNHSCVLKKKELIIKKIQRSFFEN